MKNENDKFFLVSKYNPPLLICSEEMLTKKTDTIKLKYKIHSTTILNGEKTVREEKKSIQMMYEFLDEYRGYKSILKKQVFYPMENNDKNTEGTELNYHALGLGYVYFKLDYPNFKVEIERPR